MKFHRLGALALVACTLLALSACRNDNDPPSTDARATPDILA